MSTTFLTPIENQQKIVEVVEAGTGGTNHQWIWGFPVEVCQLGALGIKVHPGEPGIISGRPGRPGSALELLLFLQTASLKSLFVREFAPKHGTIATFKESRHGHHSYAELDVSVLHRGGALGSWPSRDRIHKNCIVKVCEVHTEIFVLASQQLLQYGFPSPDHSRK